MSLEFPDAGKPSQSTRTHSRLPAKVKGAWRDVDVHQKVHDPGLDVAAYLVDDDLVAYIDELHIGNGAAELGRVQGLVYIFVVLDARDEVGDGPVRVKANVVWGAQLHLMREGVECRVLGRCKVRACVLLWGSECSGLQAATTPTTTTHLANVVHHNLMVLADALDKHDLDVVFAAHFGHDFPAVLGGVGGVILSSCALVHEGIAEKASGNESLAPPRAWVHVRGDSGPMAIAHTQTRARTHIYMPTTATMQVLEMPEPMLRKEAGEKMALSEAWAALTFKPWMVEIPAPVPVPLASRPE